MFKLSLKDLRSEKEGVSVLSGVSWNEILDYFGFKYLTRSTGVIRMLCFRHQERTPSLVCWPESGLCHCFGCGFFGNKLDFISEIGYKARSSERWKEERILDGRLNFVFSKLDEAEASRIEQEMEEYDSNAYEDLVPF